MARTKREINSTASQIGEVKQTILVLKNQLEETKKKIKEKEVELEQLENKQKLETVSEIVKITESEGVSLTDILAALQRDKSLISLIAFGDGQEAVHEPQPIQFSLITVGKSLNLSGF